MHNEYILYLYAHPLSLVTCSEMSLELESLQGSLVESLPVDQDRFGRKYNTDET